MDCVIFGNTGREFVSINLSTGILFITVNADELFQNIKVPANIEQSKMIAAHDIENGLFREYPLENWEYFLFHEGSGESLAFFFWFKKYREIHDKKILCICFNPLRAEMMKFCPYVDEVINVDKIMFDYISVFYAKRYDIKRILLAHFLPKIIAARKKLSPDEMKTYDIPEMMRDFLNINPNAKLERYPTELPEKAVAKAKKLFKEMNLTYGKVVFIIRTGYYYGRLEEHIDFWIKLRDKLRTEGYEVITNSNQVDIPACRNIFLPLLETAAFAGLCGNIVCIPTGFAESLCTLNTADKFVLQFIYPGDNDPYWKGQKVDVNKIIDNYYYYLAQYFESNVNLFCYKWGNNSAEDDLLISRIVNNITRRNFLWKLNLLNRRL